MSIKTFRSIAFSLPVLTLALAGCGQPYTPEPTPHEVGPQHRDVFGNAEQKEAYAMLPVEVLHSTLRDVLALGDAPSPDVAVLCDGFPLEQCPAGDPISFLLANEAQLGAPILETSDPYGLSAPRLFTTGGFKVWMLASSSACGRMMREQAVPVLFPNDYLPASDGLYIHDYETAFLTLLGRSPRESEVTRLDQMQMTSALSSLEKRGAAVCATLLGSLEFLGSN